MAAPLGATQVCATPSAPAILPPRHASTERGTSTAPIHSEEATRGTHANSPPPGCTTAATTAETQPPPEHSESTTSPAPDVTQDLSMADHVVQDPEEPSVPATHAYRPQTRLQGGIRKPKVLSDGTVRYGCFTSSGEPQTLHEALGDDNWKHAMDIEYDALIKNKTWHLVPPQKGRNVIDRKWVYKIKRKADGSLDRYKTRFVAKGFKQDMVLTMKTPLVLLLSLLQSELFYLLLFQEVGAFDS